LNSNNLLVQLVLMKHCCLSAWKSRMRSITHRRMLY